MAKKLTEKQRAFVEAYMGVAKGNATKAARLAGYKGSYDTLATTGEQNLKKPAILEAIEVRQLDDPHVMTRKERQQLFTKIALDVNEKTSDRLKAAELLAKTGGDFVQKVEVAANVQNANVLLYVPDNGKGNDND